MEFDDYIYQNLLIRQQKCSILSSISPYKNGGCLTRHLVDPGLATSPIFNVYTHIRIISVVILCAIILKITTIFNI